jgi:hypothetical protein
MKVTIPAGVTITVAPGAKLFIDPYVNVDVSGALILRGTSSQRITVTSAVEDVTADPANRAAQIGWVFPVAEQRSVIVEYCDFSWITGLACGHDLAPGDARIAGSFTVRECTFSNTVGGLNGLCNIRSVQENCTFENFFSFTGNEASESGTGIYIAGDFTLRGCVFKYGAGASKPATITKRHSLFVIGADPVDPAEYLIENCSFESGCDLCVYNQSGTLTTAKTLVFRGCTGAVPLPEVRPTTGIADAQSLILTRYE